MIRLREAATADDTKPSGDDAPSSIVSVLDDLEGDPNGVRITVGETLEALGRRGFGPILMFPAVIAILPVIGALPGVSMGMAFLELLIAPQIMLGRTTPWVPRSLRQVSFRRQRLVAAVRPLRPIARRIQRWTYPRLQGLTQGAGVLLAGLTATILAAGMGVGALLPGAIVPASLIMIVLALGLTTRDGVLVLVAHGLTYALVGGALWWWYG